MTPGRARRLPWKRFAAVGLLVALDLWTKAAVFDWLHVLPRPEGMVFETGYWRYPLVGEWLALMPSTNPGAAFGQLRDVPWLLVTGRIVAAVVLAVLLWRCRGERSVLVALVLVLAGALGNLYDNLFLPRPPGHPFGEVRDFIDVYFSRWTWHFPTFNVADSLISIGAVLLLLSSFGRRRRAAEGDAGEGGGDGDEERSPAEARSA